MLRAPTLQEQGTFPLPNPPIVVIACMGCLDVAEVVCQLGIHTQDSTPYTMPSRRASRITQCQRNALACWPCRRPCLREIETPDLLPTQ